MYQLRELSFPQRLPLPEAELKFVLMCQRVHFQPGLHCHFAREPLVRGEYFAVQAVLELLQVVTVPLLARFVEVLQAVPERVH